MFACKLTAVNIAKHSRKYGKLITNMKVSQVLQYYIYSLSRHLLM